MELSEISLNSVVEGNDRPSTLDYNDLPSMLMTWGEWFAQQLSDANIDFMKGWGKDDDENPFINLVFMRANRTDVAGSVYIRQDSDKKVTLLLYDNCLDEQLEHGYKLDMSKLDEDDADSLNEFICVIANESFITDEAS